MKISNRQIIMIRGAANPVKFKGIGARTRTANQVFNKGDSSRNNFIPDEGIERMGTGIRDMIRRCKKAGLAEPEIQLDGGFFVLTIRRKKPEALALSGPSRDQVTPQDTPPVTPPVAVVVLIRLIGSSGPLDNSEILSNLGLRDRTHLRERYIDPALADGMVERTIPEKPTSRLQKYRLTEKGRRLLEQLEKKKGRP